MLHSLMDSEIWLLLIAVDSNFRDTSFMKSLFTDYFRVGWLIWRESESFRKQKKKRDEPDNVVGSDCKSNPDFKKTSFVV